MQSAASNPVGPRASSGRTQPSDRRPRFFAQLAVRLPADVATRLRAFSERTGRSMNATVTAAVAHYLERESTPE